MTKSMVSAECATKHWLFTLRFHVFAKAKATRRKYFASFWRKQYAPRCTTRLSYRRQSAWKKLMMRLGLGSSVLCGTNFSLRGFVNLAAFWGNFAPHFYKLCTPSSTNFECQMQMGFEFRFNFEMEALACK